MGKEEDCPRGAAKLATCPKWVPTRARTVGGSRDPAPCRNHALHPLGFSRVVKAEEGGLTQAQHAACRETKRSEGQAELRQPSPRSTSRLSPGSEESSPPALSGTHWLHT